ncbi:MAG: LysE family transporter [Pseudomonadota bacterium]
MATIAITHLLAVMSPGQSFLLIARLSMGHGRRAAVAAALGMGLGATLWAAAALFGLAVVFAQAAWLYAAAKVIGGLFLVGLAIIVWRQASEPVAMEAQVASRTASESGPDHPLRQFSRLVALGMVTQLANPKVVLFFASIFVALLPTAMPAWMVISVLALIAIVDGGWYVLVALALSKPGARSLYARWKVLFDRATAVLLGGLGARLLTDSFWRQAP